METFNTIQLPDYAQRLRSERLPEAQDVQESKESMTKEEREYTRQAVKQAIESKGNARGSMRRKSLSAVWMHLDG
eukprot:221625-Pelagomonas_calceolata.AAC.6